jgi:hypothetical protein
MCTHKQAGQSPGGVPGVLTGGPRVRLVLFCNSEPPIWTPLMLKKIATLPPCKAGRRTAGQHRHTTHIHENLYSTGPAPCRLHDGLILRRNVLLCSGRAGGTECSDIYKPLCKIIIGMPRPLLGVRPVIATGVSTLLYCPFSAS